MSILIKRSIYCSFYQSSPLSWTFPIHVRRKRETISSTSTTYLGGTTIRQPPKQQYTISRIHNTPWKQRNSEQQWRITIRSSSMMDSYFGNNNKERGHRTYASSSSSSSSTKKKKKNPFENTLGVTFTISPDQAMEKFIKWAQIEQGLSTYIMNPSKVQVTAAYCPVWSFDLNLRFLVTNTTTGRKRLDWKPEIFRTVYGTQSIVHIPGLSAYAGYTYRRTLMDPLHNTTLVFLYDKVVPFGAWMLRDMQMSSNNATIPIVPDPWNAPPGRALSIVKEGLESLTEGLAEDETVRVQTELVTSRRVYMPTYVIKYYILGMEYQAFISGCDDGATVSGVSHKVFDVDPSNVSHVSAHATGYLATALKLVQSAVRLLGGRQIGTLIVVALQFFGSLAARLLLRLPLIGAIGGAFVGFRKIIQPWMDNRSASADWERQREREASLYDKVDHINDFTDTGTARRYFQANRDRILRSLAGTSEHGEGSFNWYSEWEKWARQQWEQQQQQQTYTQQQQQTQTQKQKPRQQKARPSAEYVWDFDPNDPYSILGVRRGATASEVSAAFRKQMMLHHPDTKANGSEAEKARAIERSKLITSAYQTIKSQMKR